VLGSDYRGLAVVRSLGRRGIPVWVIREGEDSLAARSRYATRRLPLRGESDAERCAFLCALADEEGLDGWALFPTADDTAAMVARAHRRLDERYALTTPPWDVLRWAHDKRLTYRLATSLALPHPKTWPAGIAADATAREVDFPVLIKPALKPGFNRLTAAKAWRVDDVERLRERLAEAATLVEPELLLIQELIPGGGESQFSFAALCDHGRVLARVVARRTRQYPADLGRASTFVETIDDEEVAELAQRFLAEMRFTGLVEVEFKRDPRDGLLKLLDVNPRVWGWHGLCRRAGVDFPFLAWCLALGEPVPPSRAITGVRWLRLSTDLPTSLREVARGRLSVRGYLRSLGGPRERAIFAGDDPWPGLTEVPMLAVTLLRRLASGHGV
jgi:D-aspartate ligase